MLQAILEGAAMFGPIVLLMLTPVLIPIITLTISTLTDRGKKPTTPTGS